ncbi:hypothetical protein BO71DRAFT_439917 [Aspergillus ellipticus CBS 707.79]|uniref:Uncharacterized protein n=1 Tax=Aspergillus ellipticus CBS 707.79 TaxID=1448320 RepID=A0A319DES2_9EURO|nr:hypothetical protein BO71DRAFT_439917 [Aspergillus ellipticus CBS 707.79]
MGQNRTEYEPAPSTLPVARYWLGLAGTRLGIIAVATAPHHHGHHGDPVGVFRTGGFDDWPWRARLGDPGNEWRGWTKYGVEAFRRRSMRVHGAHAIALLMCYESDDCDLEGRVGLPPAPSVISAVQCHLTVKGPESRASGPWHLNNSMRPRGQL